MKTKYPLMFLSAVWLGVSGCSEDHIYSSSLGEGERIVNLKATIEHLNLTRADDSGFADGDRIGIYMVDFENGVPISLKSSGNHADNQSFVYNEKSGCWDSSLSLFFNDDSTPADFYGYYPYIDNIVDATSIPFSVQSNQASDATVNELSGYEKSDLLWVSKSGVSPNENVVNLTFSHILAGLEIDLIEGEGFEADEWINLEKKVIIDNTINEGIFDISTGSVSVVGSSNVKHIVANPTEKGFRAVVLPQVVAKGYNLMTISIGGDSYSFQKDVSINYTSGKLHKFTFEVSKKELNGDYLFELIGESVTVWESDLNSHDGQVKAYQIVDIEKGQRLQDILDSLKLNPKEIVNLKLTGFMDCRDFHCIRDTMVKLQALNLQNVRILDVSDEKVNWIPNRALSDRATLRYIVFPDVLEGIDNEAFIGTSIEGSLRIPEGVKYIGTRVFTNYGNYDNALASHNNLTGTLELPSTLEYIGNEAFQGCDFTGPLILPNSLKYLGADAFNGCRNFTGGLHLPESLSEIGGSSESDRGKGVGVFSGMSGLGVLDIPKNLKVINGFGGIEVSDIHIPEEAVEIGSVAFCKTKVKGGIVIPENVSTIGSCAFYGCNATSISLPEKIVRINESTFEMCINLGDTMVVPQNVEIIEKNAFYGCKNLQALELPSKLTYIGDEAFGACYSLQYIHCSAIEPPAISERTFWSVEKDNFTLEVPEGSVEAYRNAPGWGEFKRISAYKGFVARPSKYNVLNKGGKKEIILNADDAWEMVECPSWCHIDRTSGVKKTVLTLTVEPMSPGSSNRSGNVIFRLKGANDYETHINVGQYDYEYDEDSYIELQKATKGNGIDLFLLGDGYDAIDISSGILMKDMKQTIEYFFGVEPYTSYREYFNVYTGIAMSEDSGVEETNRWRTTKFHTLVPKQCGERISADWNAALDYVGDICPILTEKPNPKVGVILLANYNGYDGITYSAGDSFCALVTKSDYSYPNDARGLVQHEAGGHGIGWLADEYIYHNDFIDKCKCSCCKHTQALLSEQEWGYGLNVSLNGKYKEVPWSHMVFNLAYGDIVDIYEGGYFHARGVFRSEYNSCMNNNIPYFSSWSRQLIVQRIKKLAGEPFSLEQFYANDSREQGRDFTVSRSMDRDNSAALHGNPPVFIKNYKFGKKGGRK